MSGDRPLVVQITDQDGRQEVVGVGWDRRSVDVAVLCLKGSTWDAILTAINYQLRPDYTGGRPYELQALIEEDDPDLGRLIRDAIPHLHRPNLHLLEMTASTLQEVKRIVEAEMTILRRVYHQPILRSDRDEKDLERRIAILHGFHRLTTI